MKRVRLDSPHGRSLTEVLAALNVSFASGFSDHEAEQRLSLYGANAIGSRQKAGLISILVHQFRSLGWACSLLPPRSHSTFGNGRKAAPSLAS